jgi:hypothetical protein
MLALLLVYVTRDAARMGLPINRLVYVKRFLLTFSDWNFNEGSVASFCCGLTGENIGSAINEHEGIDSDDESIANRRTSQESSSVLGSTEDEVHPHKRLRFELGQIRDLRRFYEVENSRIDAVSFNSATSVEDNPLDSRKADVFTVFHPMEPGVNLGIRMLESYRKLIIQEIRRARFLLEDVMDDVDSTYDSLMEPIDRISSCPVRVNIDINSDSSQVASILSRIILDQSWFLVQELQAFSGVLVVPPCEVVGHVCSVGLAFPKDVPYGAHGGIELDLSGALSKHLMRIRRSLQDRPDWRDKLEGKFSISCDVQKQ